MYSEIAAGSSVLAVLSFRLTDAIVSAWTSSASHACVSMVCAFCVQYGVQVTTPLVLQLLLRSPDTYTAGSEGLW